MNTDVSVADSVVHIHPQLPVDENDQNRIRPSNGCSLRYQVNTRALLTSCWQ